MAKVRTISDKFFLFIKGLAMGAANKVPGVSGGIVAFVGGFYEELIYSLQKVNVKALKLLFNGRFKSFYKYTNAQFLTLIFAGSIFSYFSVSQVLDYFIKNYELFVWSAFFGMIIGSIYYISKQFKNWSTQNIIGIISGIVIGVAISFMNPAKENDNLFFVFFCGIIGVTGMTLPGLSGSFILILLGNYVLLLVDSVNMLYKTIIDVFQGNFEFLKDAVRIRYIKIVAVFGIGSAFGLVFTSKILAYVLKRWHQLVTAIIIGFISGSLGIVWPWKRAVYKLDNNEFLLDSKGQKVIENYKRFIPNFTETETWIAITFIIMGIGIVLLIDFYGKNSKEKKILEEQFVRTDRVVFEGGEDYEALKSLNEYQQSALGEINNAFSMGKVTLLHGVTSSGKTEVYVKLIEDFIAKGKQALYLLPEIALTTQLISRLQSVTTPSGCRNMCSSIPRAMSSLL